MGRLKKRKGYSAIQAQTGNVSASGSTVTLPSGLTINGTTITTSPYISSNQMYITSPGHFATIQMEPWTYVEYEPIHPIAIKEHKSQKRLIIWEP